MMKRLYLTICIAVLLLAAGGAGFFFGHRHASSRARLFEVALAADELVHTTVALEQVSPEQNPEAHALLKRRVGGTAVRLNMLLDDCPPAFGACQQALSGLTYLTRNPELVQFAENESVLTNDKLADAIESSIRKARPLRDEGLYRELRQKYPDKATRDRAFQKMIDRLDAYEAPAGDALKAAPEEPR